MAVGTRTGLALAGAGLFRSSNSGTRLNRLACSQLSQISHGANRTSQPDDSNVIACTASAVIVTHPPANWLFAHMSPPAKMSRTVHAIVSFAHAGQRD